jgi:hypothetical protein
MRDVSPRLRAERTARARVRTAWRPERTRTASSPCDRNHQGRPPAQSRQAATDQVLHHHRQRGCRPVDGREVLLDTPQRSTAPARTPDPPKRLLPGTQPKVERASLAWVDRQPAGGVQRSSLPGPSPRTACRGQSREQLPAEQRPIPAIRSRPFPAVA